MQSNRKLTDALCFEWAKQLAYSPNADCRFAVPFSEGISFLDILQEWLVFKGWLLHQGVTEPDISRIAVPAGFWFLMPGYVDIDEYRGYAFKRWDGFDFQPRVAMQESSAISYKMGHVVWNMTSFTKKEVFSGNLRRQANAFGG